MPSPGSRPAGPRAGAAAAAILAAALCAAPPAAAVVGGRGLLTLTGLPPDIVFRESVPETRRLPVTLTLRGSVTDYCNGETWAQITIPDAIEAVFPCYVGHYHPDPEVAVCYDGVGTDGEPYALVGDGGVRGLSGSDYTRTLQLELRYDGSTPAVRHGEWRLLSDGRCTDFTPPDYRVAGSVNIHILPAGESFDRSFTVTVEGSRRNYFYLDRPELNGRHDAVLIVTEATADEERPREQYGVWYSRLRRRWAIYLENRDPMGDGRRFHVAVAGYRDQRGWVHTATSTNSSFHLTYLEHPAIDANPWAQLLVTHVWNPPGAARNYHDHPVGVWYNPFNRRWAIFNEDRTAMPAGTTFNVVAAAGSGREVGPWPDRSPYLSIYYPVLLTHLYSPASRRYLPSPLSLHVRSIACHPLFGCVSDIGPASVDGRTGDSYRFVTWVP